MEELVVHKEPARTRIIRVPATGPDPANTLVYLDCEVLGISSVGLFGKWYTERDEFRTEFRIDGFQQQNYDWYKSNTLVSATGMLRFFAASTDLIFSGGLDAIEPNLELDGTLSFSVLTSIYGDDEAWFPENGESLSMRFRISAYVLCYEPRVDTPPAGSRRQSWKRRFDPSETVKASSAVRDARPGPGIETVFKRAPRLDRLENADSEPTCPDGRLPPRRGRVTRRRTPRSET